jgi:hypothetical protein
MLDDYEYKHAITGLWTREVYADTKKKMELIMETLTCSFAFECKEIAINNGFGYEIQLPRIIIN